MNKTMAKQRLITTYYSDDNNQIATSSFYICSKRELKDMVKRIREFFKDNPGQTLTIPIGNNTLSFRNESDVFGTSISVDKISQKQANIIAYRITDDFGPASIRDVVRAMNQFVPPVTVQGSFGFDAGTYNGTITIPNGGWITSSTDKEGTIITANSGLVSSNTTTSGYSQVIEE